MKKMMIYTVLSLVICGSISSCTMGDKGSERVPDSVGIDTAHTPTVQEAKQDSIKALIDSLQTDTGQSPSKNK